MMLSNVCSSSFAEHFFLFRSSNITQTLKCIGFSVALANVSIISCWIKLSKHFWIILKLYENVLPVPERKKVKSVSRVQLFVTPWTVACQAPPSMGFSRQKYWSGLPRDQTRVSCIETTDAQDKKHRCKCRCVHWGSLRKEPPKSQPQGYGCPHSTQRSNMGKTKSEEKSVWKFSLEKNAPCNRNLVRGSSRGFLRKCVHACWVTSLVSDSLPPYGLQSARLLGHLGSL